MSMLAAAAVKMEKDIRKKQMKEDHSEALKQLAITRNDLEVAHDFEKDLVRSRDKAIRALVDANKRADTAGAEVKEAQSANSRLENKFRTMQGLLEKRDELVEKLQGDLTVIRGEKAEMEKLLREITAK